MTRKTRNTTNARHKAVYERFKALEAKLRDNGKYNSIFLTSLYTEVGDEMGYSENYVCRIVKKIEKQ